MPCHLDSGRIAATLKQNAKTIRANNNSAALSQLAVLQPEIQTTRQGVLVANTGKFTGRSPGDKFIVADEKTKDTVWWENTNAMVGDDFDRLLGDMLDHLSAKALFLQQLNAGAERAHGYSVDVWTPSAWHALFIRNLLIEPSEDELVKFLANVSIVHAPSFEADPKRHNSKTSTCIALDLSRNIILICGTAYAGEIKKSVFSLFNYHAPDADILPMHCSANVSEQGETTLFFGLSGTGKTTLSTAADRALVGDDEHGWSASSVFNLEGGCYAKAIDLSAEKEPEIYQAAQHPAALLENVVIDPVTGEPDYTDSSLTENTRIAYPLDAIPNRVESGISQPPKNIVLLTADAFGVLPPIAQLSHAQAIYYFLSGYTAKVAGTERGIVEPTATFSACFGAPFMARHPSDYGALLAKRLSKSDAKCWLLNTGWTGGAYGVGERISLKNTRRILEAALSGELEDSQFRTDPIFKLQVPIKIEGVEDALLCPSQSWPDKEAFNETAQKLVALFDENFKKLGVNAESLVLDNSRKNNVAA